MQACGVITAYDFSQNFLGKLSPVLMSVPQKTNSKLGLVKRRAKSLGKKPLPFSQGLRKACTAFFFPELVKWPLGHAFTCTEGNIFIRRKRHWELQWLRSGTRLFVLWRRPKASINQKRNKLIFHRGKKRKQPPDKTRSVCHFCISALSLWIEKFAGSDTSTLASTCPLGSTFPSLLCTPELPVPWLLLNHLPKVCLKTHYLLPTQERAISFPPKKVHLLPLVSLTFFSPNWHSVWVSFHIPLLLPGASGCYLDPSLSTLMF